MVTSPATISHIQAPSARYLHWYFYLQQVSIEEHNQQNEAHRYPRLWQMVRKGKSNRDFRGWNLVQNYNFDFHCDLQGISTCIIS